MGPTPKPSKRRRQSAANLPLLPSDRPPNQPLRPQQSANQPHAAQDRIPAGPSYETTVNLPTIPQLLEQIAGVDDDGYFKFVPGSEGHSWYLTYRWKWGKWAKHYVMAVVIRGDLHYGLVLLCEKVAGVRSGRIKPTLDRYDGDQ